MLELRGYHIEANEAQGRYSGVYRALNEAQESVWIQMYQVEDVAALDEGLKRHMYREEALHADIVRPLAFHWQGEQLMVVFGDGGQPSLRELVSEGPVTLSDFVRLACELTALLELLHRVGASHQDLHPENVLVKPETSGVRLLYTPVASLIQAHELQTSSSLQRRLLYMAPELLERVERADWRCDLYALGAMFYEMLTGQPVFSSQEPREANHGHLVQAVVAPEKLRPELPSVFSRIVMKLLQKKPTARYQSTTELLEDLRLCRQHVEGGSAAEELEGILPMQDEGVRELRWPDELIGRKLEREAIEQVFARTCEGSAEMILLSGADGIGKSRLLRWVQEALCEGQVTVVRGSFQKQEQQLPYAMFSRILDGLLAHILTEDDEELQRWKGRFLDAVGQIGQLVVDFVPRLAHITGPLPSVVLSPFHDTEERLFFAFRQLFQVFCRWNKPLVLCVEQMHLASAESLRLLEALFEDKQPEGFLFIGTYSRDAIKKSHPLMGTFERLFDREISILSLYLQPLKPDEVVELLAKALGESVSHVRPLAQRLHRRSQGLPLFLQRLLFDLESKGLVSFSSEAGWQWDLDAVDALPASGRFEAFLDAELAALPARELDLLKVLSCLGEHFAMSLLYRVWKGGKGSRSESEELLSLLTQKKLLRSTAQGFRFAHESIQQVIYKKLDALERAQIHREVGMLLRESYEDKQDPVRMFEIVHHLHQGEPGWSEDHERIGLCELYLEAGESALAAGLFAAADSYFHKALDFLGEEDWESNGALTTRLHLARAQSAFSCGNLKDSEEILEILCARVVGVPLRTEVWSRKVTLLQRRGDVDKALTAGLKGLAELGVHFPHNPSGAGLLWRLCKTEWARRFLSVDEWLARGPARDEEIIATLRLIADVMPSAYMVNPRLLGAMTLYATTLGFVHGYAGASVRYLLGYAVLLWEAVGAHRTAFALGQLALRLAREMGEEHRSLEGEIYHCVMLSCWDTPWQTCAQTLGSTSKRAALLGLSEAAGYGKFSRLALLMSTGLRLEEIEQESWAVAEQLRGYGYLVGAEFSGFCQRWARMLRDLPQGLVWTDWRQDDPLQTSSFSSFEHEFPILTVRIYEAMLLCFFGRYAEAFDLLDAFAQPNELLLGNFLYAEYTFVHALSALGSFRHLSNAEDKPLTGRACLQLVQRSLRKFRLWRKFSYENFHHKVLLLEAELARVKGFLAEAMTLYARAHKSAEANGFTHHRALIDERRAFLAAQQGWKLEAQLYTEEARRGYVAWGALAKVKHLESTQGAWLERSHRVLETERSLVEATRSLRASPVSRSSREQTLDFTAALRASIALSEEVEFEKVMERVMSSTIENAGAQRGLLLLVSARGLTLEIEGSVQNVIFWHGSKLLKDCENLLPRSLVQYVQRGQEAIVLADASQAELFKEDPYIIEKKAKSLLCMPIRRQRRLVGVLYLENHLVTNAFAYERLQLLQLLAAQAAISLHNARLYGELTELNSDLEQRVERRTRELEEARDGAQAATRAKDEFLATMSHEIRTPMNGISGMSQLLGQTELTPEQQEYLGIIRSSNEILLSLLNDILDFSRLEMGKLTLESSPFGLRESIGEIGDILMQEVNEKQLKFVFSIDAQIPEWLCGDVQRLKQVLLNLLNNAVKFTEEGSVTLRVKPQGTNETQSWLHFAVEDTGIGVPEDRQERLFQSFSQVDASITRRYGGSGLGLAICKRLVEMMGGQIGFESTCGEGSTFWFSLPFAHAQPPQDASRLHEIVEQMRFWLVEPCTEQAHSLVALLHYLGGKAQSLGSCTQVMEKLQKQDDRALEVLFLAVQAAEADKKAAKRLCTFAQEEGIQLLVVGLGAAQERAKAAAVPCFDDFLMRPVKLSSLRALLLRKIDQAPPKRIATPIPARPPETRTEEVRVLIVEDQPVNQRLVMLLLQKVGYLFDVANNGEEALEACAQEAYDLILMDCQMPVLDGFSATRQIRQMGGWCKEVPIIAMTAYAMEGDRTRCIEAGMSDYVTKPFKANAFLSLLEQHLNNS